MIASFCNVLTHKDSNIHDVPESDQVSSIPTCVVGIKIIILHLCAHSTSFVWKLTVLDLKLQLTESTF